VAILKSGLNDVMGATVAAHASGPLKLISKAKGLRYSGIQESTEYKDRPL
jgi:hypothetical protein